MNILPTLGLPGLALRASPLRRRLTSLLLCGHAFHIRPLAHVRRTSSDARRVIFLDPVLDYLVRCLGPGRT